MVLVMVVVIIMVMVRVMIVVVVAGVVAVELSSPKSVSSSAVVGAGTCAFLWIDVLSLNSQGCEHSTSASNCAFLSFC